MPLAFRRLSRFFALLLLFSSSGCALLTAVVPEPTSMPVETATAAIQLTRTPTAQTTPARATATRLLPSPTPTEFTLETPASTPTRVSAARTSAPVAAQPTPTPDASRPALLSLNFDVLYLRQGSLYRWSHVSKQNEVIFGPSSPGLLGYFEAETPLFPGEVIEFAADGTGSRLVALVDRGVSANGVGLYDLLLIDLERGAARTLLPETRRLSRLLPSPDGSRLAYINASNGRLSLLSLEGEADPQDIAACQSADNGECALAWSLSGKYLAWADSQGVWQSSAPEWQPVQASPLVIAMADIDGSQREVQVYASSLTWAPFDRYLLAEVAPVGGEPRWLAVVDMRTGSAGEVPGLVLPEGSSLPAAWFPDGRLITMRPSRRTRSEAGAASAVVEIWQVFPTRQPQTLTRQNTFEVPLDADAFADLQVIANRYLLFRAQEAGSLSGSLVRLDLEFGRLNWTLTLAGGVYRAAWAPDGSGAFLQVAPDIGLYAAAGSTELDDLRGWFGEDLDALTWCLATGKTGSGGAE